MLTHDAGPQHNLRLRQWQIGRVITILIDKATLAGITVAALMAPGAPLASIEA